MEVYDSMDLDNISNKDSTIRDKTKNDSWRFILFFFFVKNETKILLIFLIIFYLFIYFLVIQR